MRRFNDNWLQQAVEGLKKGDKDAFDVLFYNFEAKIFNFSFKLTHNKEDAEEVVQEVFLKVWERREVLQPQNNFESFIFTIAKNIVYNKTRHRVYEFAYKEYMMKFGSTEVSNTEEWIDFKELEAIIQFSCEQLPPVRRKVFTLSRFHGLTNDEIAERLKTSTSNVKNHIYKALIFLKKQIRLHNVARGFLLFLTVPLK